MSPRIQGLVVSFVILLTAPVALAQEERATATLEYESPDDEGCPSEQVFRDIVAGRLGYDPFVDEAPLRVQAQIEQAAGGFVGRVSLFQATGEPAGERDISPAVGSCHEIATSMALAISIVLDPFGTASESSSEQSSSEQAPPTEPAPPPPADPLPEEWNPPPHPEEEESGSEMVAHIGLSLGFGATPAVTLGPTGGFGARFGPVLLMIEANGEFMPSEGESDFGDPIDVSIVTLGPTACAVFGVGIGCASVQFGIYRAIANSVVEPKTQAAFFSAGELSAGVLMPFSDRFSFRAVAVLRANFVVPELAIDDAPVWEASPIGGGIRIGLGASFP